MSYLVANDQGPTISGVDEEAATADNKTALFPVDYVGVGYRDAVPGSVLTVVSVDGRVLARRVVTDTSGVVEVGHSGVVVATLGDTAVKLLLK